MNQSEALTLAVEMLERVAPGRNYDTREFYDRLRDIKATISPSLGREMVDEAATASEAPPRLTMALWPRTAILDGEEFCEIERRTIEGRDLILMESCRDGGEAPGAIIDARTNEVVLFEAPNGFRDYRESLSRI
jgi:hypothetical protein